MLKIHPDKFIHWSDSHIENIDFLLKRLHENFDIVCKAMSEIRERVKTTKKKLPMKKSQPQTNLPNHAYQVMIYDSTKNILIPKKIICKIAVDGAAHTKNIRPSTSDKHAKGIRQRVIQRRNAIRRFKKYGFSFNGNVKEISKNFEKYKIQISKT